MQRRVAALGVLGVGFVSILSACSSFPELDETLSAELRSADYPALLPAEDLRAQVNTGPLEPRQRPIVAQAQQIDNRADALRARAAGLRGDVIDAEDRDRLNTEITIEDEDV